jgi:hypothetical protein
MVLVVRAIFISPSQGSEFGHSPRLGDSSLKRQEVLRPTRLRFTKPCPPSSSIERLDCLDGSDGDDDERTSLDGPSTEAWYWVISTHPALARRLSMAASPRSLVQLRC